jgi:hypothetical protein
VCIAKVIGIPDRWVASPPRLAFEGLELCDGKLSRTVLRGLGASDGPRLPGLDGDLINKELFIIGFHFNSVNMEIDGTFST